MDRDASRLTTIRARRRDRGVRHLGTGAGLLEAAPLCPGAGNSRASLCLDAAFHDPASHLAAALAGSAGERCARARTALFCAGSGIAIAVNWFFFIWAVNAGHVLETSLGYFMTPLVNVLFGALFLRERLTRAQLLSVLLATRRGCLSHFRFRPAALGRADALLFVWHLTVCSAKSRARRRFPGCFSRRQ